MRQEWLGIIRGDERSFTRLYDEYYRPLFYYALKIRQDRELANECLHILFCELWEKRERLPITIQDPKFYLFTWLKRIIIKNIPVEAIAVDSLNELLIEDSIETQRIEIEELFEIHQKLERALLKLTNKQRRFVELRFYENKSYEEICVIENASMRTVYNVLYEALKRLKGNIAFQSLIIFIFSK